MASEFGLSIIGVTANIRDAIVIYSGLIHPIAGIVVGLIGGLYRMSGLFWKGFSGTLGYWTAVGCGIATILAGLVGAFLYRKGYTVLVQKPKDYVVLITIMCIYEVIHVSLIAPVFSPPFICQPHMEATAKKLGISCDSYFSAMITSSIALVKTVLIGMIVANTLCILALILITKDCIYLSLTTEKAEEQIEKLRKVLSSIERYKEVKESEK